jgi:hypothetical protein
MDLSYQDDAEQLSAYKSLFPVVWESPYVAGVTLWGYVYGSTWSQASYSGLIKDGKERPALTWLKTYVASHLDVPTPTSPTTGIADKDVATPDSGRRLRVSNEGGHLQLRALDGNRALDLQGRR